MRAGVRIYVIVLSDELLLGQVRLLVAGSLPEIHVHTVISL